MAQLYYTVDKAKPSVIDEKDPITDEIYPCCDEIDPASPSTDVIMSVKSDVSQPFPPPMSLPVHKEPYEEASGAPETPDPGNYSFYRNASGSNN
jgi:hypothetical protein